MVLASHNLAEVEHLRDDVVLLRGGRTVSCSVLTANDTLNLPPTCSQVILFQQ